MKKLITTIGVLRLQVLVALITIVALIVTIPFTLYIAISLFAFILIFSFSFVEHMWLRLLYDKYNCIDVYLSIDDGTWKSKYTTVYNDQLSFILFDPVGKLAKNVMQTKVLTYQAFILISYFPDMMYQEENVWVKGKHTSVSVLRNKQQFSYKNT